ncbi:MAG: MG2 domain-containing protein, partial [Herbaspirillum sp.]
STRPHAGATITEEQMFIVLQNGAATKESLAQHVFCEAENVHERIPAALIVGAPRSALLKEFFPKRDPEQISIFQCQQRLPAGAKVQLVWDKGIQTPSGVPTSVRQVIKFEVRADFTASFSCQRENANAACAPVLPVRLDFSTPVSRKLAENIVLTDGRGKNKPFFGHDDRDDTVTSVKFMPPFSEKSEFTISLPSNFVDMDDRPLSNAAQFPLKSSMAAFPPLAKFAAAPFGILELNADPVLPVTLRNVEQNLPANRTSPGTISSFRVDDDAAIIRWIAKVDQYHEGSIDVAPAPKFGAKAKPEYVATRELSLLGRAVGVKKLNLPASQDVKGQGAKENLRPFEVVGIPLPAPGFYVLELASQRLGNALLGKVAPMYVRTSALVTNLSVHIKLGRENGAVWVTTLDSAKPVADADVRMSDCTGKELWRGKTAANGVALLPQAYPTECPESSTQARPLQSGLFVSARKTDDKGRADMAFALSTWNSGIESYRFNLPTDFSIDRSVRAHSVLDRTLFRAGETVSMKHFIRAETMRGFDLLSDKQLPNRVRIVHQGSGQEFQFPLTWRGRKSAQTVFAIPKQAKLGQYQIILDHGEVKKTSTGNGTTGDSDDQDRAGADGDGNDTFYTGSFRVEEFRLPLLSGSITPPKGPLISPKEIPLSVQLTYLNGGGAAGAQVHVSSLLRDRYQSFSEYEAFSFSTNTDWDRASEDGASSGGDDQKIVADKLAITLDKNGAGKTVIKKLPQIVKPQDLLTEMTFADLNGEIQTISTVSTLSPSALVVGIKSSDWVSLKKKANLTALALDLNGKPQAGVMLEIL